MAKETPPSTTKAQPTKLARLPPNARVNKRKIPRAAIASPHSGASQPKIINVGAKTPFLSTVKRVEKVLSIADRRAVQSATTTVSNNRKNHHSATFSKRKHGSAHTQERDDILEIAKTAERAAQDGKYKGTCEAVILRGTGKAIGRVMELALWFQKRGDTFVVKLRTGTAEAVDDIEVDDEPEASTSSVTGTKDATDTAMVDVAGGDAEGDTNGSKEAAETSEGVVPAKAETEPIPETRIRQLSSLEVSVSRR